MGKTIVSWSSVHGQGSTTSHTVALAVGLDLSKKTDGHVTILGEVATDPVAAWMIQLGQVVSLFPHNMQKRSTTKAMRN